MAASSSLMRTNEMGLSTHPSKARSDTLVALALG
jgi:hypothetical protein